VKLLLNMRKAEALGRGIGTNDDRVLITVISFWISPVEIQRGSHLFAGGLVAAERVPTQIRSAVAGCIFGI
jgi:hypothetical protein